MDKSFLNLTNTKAKLHGENEDQQIVLVVLKIRCNIHFKSSKVSCLGAGSLLIFWGLGFYFIFFLESLNMSKEDAVYINSHCYTSDKRSTIGAGQKARKQKWESGNNCLLDVFPKMLRAYQFYCRCYRRVHCL